MQELISVKQLPIIEQHLKSLSAEIDRKVSDALSLAVTEDTVKDVKAVRADLNKLYKDLESQRKTVKKAILEPYEAFEEIYRTYISVRLEDGDAELKRKINAVEAQLRQEKISDLKNYFRELADSEHLTWLDYERGNINVTLSKSRNALHKEVDSFVERVSEGWRTIEALPDSAEVAAEYKRTLNLGDSVEIVRKRHEAIEQEEREREHLAEMRKREEETAQQLRKAAEENPVLSAPKKVVEEKKEPELLTLTFSVTDTRDRLKVLKAFLDGNHYQYE